MIFTFTHRLVVFFKSHVFHRMCLQLMRRPWRWMVTMRIQVLGCARVASGQAQYSSGVNLDLKSGALHLRGTHHALLARLKSTSYENRSLYSPFV